MEPLTSNSESEFDGFYTKVKIEEIEDIFKLKLFVTYKGNEYETSGISPWPEHLILLGRTSHKKEDLELGFKEHYPWEWTGFDKEITREEIESIGIERENVYDELFELLGEENKKRRLLNQIEECINILSDEKDSLRLKNEENKDMRETIRYKHCHKDSRYGCNLTGIF